MLRKASLSSRSASGCILDFDSLLPAKTDADGIRKSNESQKLDFAKF